MLLAIESSTNICSVAVSTEEGEIFEERADEKGSHSEKMFLFIEKLMNEHHFTVDDLEAVVVSEGPGSYTGLRISASAVKGLLFDSSVDVYAVNTLASFAEAARVKNSALKRVHSIIDARRVHLYHQLFEIESGELKSSDRVEVIPIEHFQTMIKPKDGLIGTGLNRLDDKILEQVTVYGSEMISAGSLLQILKSDRSPFIKQIAPREFEPRYYTSSQV